MNSTARNLRLRLRVRRGFSLVETSVSTFFVGVLLVAALTAVDASVQSQMKTSRNVLGAMLADSLMSEILAKSYMEPGATSSIITREAGELATSKANYDDVDDYQGWQEQPPQYANGNNMPNLTNWKRQVTVEWITIANNGTIAVANSESNIKRVTVVVSYNGSVVVTRQALSTNP
jgi:Tfp pilus assembly protein PilV